MTTDLKFDPNAPVGERIAYKYAITAGKSGGAAAAVPPVLLEQGCLLSDAALPSAARSWANRLRRYGWTVRIGYAITEHPAKYYVGTDKAGELKSEPKRMTLFVIHGERADLGCVDISYEMVNEKATPTIRRINKRMNIESEKQLKAFVEVDLDEDSDA